MPSKKLLFKCVWHDDKTSISVYADKNGRLTLGFDGTITRHPAEHKYVLNEIASAVSSQYGYLKTFYLNTAEFARVFGSDNVVKCLEDHKCSGFRK